MKQQIAHIMLSVNDMQASIDFYKILGFNEEYQSEEWSELQDSNNTLELALRKRQTDEDSTNPYSGLGFVVENCQIFTDELKYRNITPVVDFEKTNDGLTIKKINDPDGNVVWITQSNR